MPPDHGFATPADLAHCRAQLRGGSRSFHAASLVLPRAVREPAIALYGFCRMADDAIDLGDDRLGRLARLRERLDCAYAGRPLPFPADRAFADVIVRFAMPRALPEALLEGLEWDAAGRRYADLPALSAYAARVAGSVGAMMALLMGRAAPEAVARACDLGVAMQLSNIARDVGEDARMGRIYLPLSWLVEAGIEPEAWLARPVFDPALGGVVARLLAVADGLYRRAEAGIAALPRGCRPGIRAARLIYAEIGREVERLGCNSVAQRAVVSGRRKAALLGRALLPTGGERRPAAAHAAPLDETLFLVEAAAQGGAAPRRPSLTDRLVWTIGLLERLEQRRVQT
ncbi:MAG: phytoene/squalene synthase family protein [Dongiaceae bacterium]